MIDPIPQEELMQGGLVKDQGQNHPEGTQDQTRITVLEDLKRGLADQEVQPIMNLDIQKTKGVNMMMQRCTNQGQKRKRLKKLRK